MLQHTENRAITTTIAIGSWVILLGGLTTSFALANDFHGFIQADRLPQGFTADFEDDEPRFLVVRKNGSKEFDATVIAQRGNYSTYVSRVRAIDALARVACQSLKKNGYKVLQQEQLDIYDDLTKPKNVSILFSKEESQRPLAMRFWFQRDQAFCAAAHGLDKERHWWMLQWISSVDASQGEMGEPVRFWRLDDGRNTPGQLRWWHDDHVQLALGGGKVVDVPLQSLSRADRRYVERSGLTPVTLEDDEMGFRLSLPIGFSAGIADGQNQEPTGSFEFIHLDGTTIRIQVVPQSHASIANVANVLQVEPTQIRALTDTKVDIRFVERRAKEATRRTYVAFVGATSLVIETTAMDDRKRQYHWSKIEDAMRALRPI